MPFEKNNRTRLKSYFVKNAIPTEQQFAELMDGMLIQGDDGLVKPANDPLSIEASGDQNSQKKAIHFYDSFADNEPAWVLSLNPRQDPNTAATARRGLSIGDSAGTSRLFIDRATGNVGVGTIAPDFKLTVTQTENHLQLRRDPASTGGKMLFLELKQADTPEKTVPEVYPSIRFHHGNRFWHRLEARADGFHFKEGNMASDGYRSVFTGGVRALADSNPINFTSSWSGTPDAVTNTAEICNDTNKYKTLMIIGNRSAGRQEPGRGRRVSVWDVLEVNGDLTVTRNARFNGRLGVGVAPAQELHVYGSGNVDVRVQSSEGSFIDFGTGEKGHFVYGYANLPLYFGTNGAERMRLDGAGSLGIGTQSPKAPLHVKGNAGVLNLEGSDHNYIQWYPQTYQQGRKAWVGFGGAGTKDFSITNETPDGDLRLVAPGTTVVPNGALIHGLGIGTQVHGKTKYTYETIQLHPNHNLRIWYGTTERFQFAGDGAFYIRFDKGYWVFQTDGNLVKYRNGGTPLWALNKVSGHAGW